MILARFKLAVVLEGGYARVVQGEADNPKMDAFGDVVLELAEQGGRTGRHHHPPLSRWRQRSPRVAPPAPGGST